jgi:proteasome assembly chaperone (PAC2) family protein
MERSPELIVFEQPGLRKPYLVCGISGWVDAGEAATGTVKYLIKKLLARKFAEIPLAPFHIFQVPGQTTLRPHIRIEEGLLEQHQFPANEFFYWVNPRADRDLVLFLGTEPCTRWEEFAGVLLDFAAQLQVARIYLLGGVLDKIPHTREPLVSCVVSAPELREEMRKFALQPASYEGPGSFGTTLLHFCQLRGMEMVSMVSRATFYPEFNTFIPHNPKAIYALLRRLNRLLHLGLDLSDAESASREMEGKLDFMATQNPQFRAYLKQLEKEFVEVKYQEPLEITGNQAVEIVEELLKGEKGDDEESAPPAAG